MHFCSLNRGKAQSKKLYYLGSSPWTLDAVFIYSYRGARAPLIEQQARSERSFPSYIRYTNYKRRSRLRLN